MNIYKKIRFMRTFSVNYDDGIIIKCPNGVIPIRSESSQNEFIIAYFKSDECINCKYVKKCIRENCNDGTDKIKIKNNKRDIKDESINNNIEETLKEHFKDSKLDYVEILEKGIYYKRLGNYDLAKICCIKAIQINNQRPQAYYNLGKMLYLLEDYEASVNSYLLAIKCDIEGFFKVSEYGPMHCYRHLGHSLIDKTNKNNPKYNGIIKNYTNSIAKGKRVALTEAVNLYEKMCAKAAEKYLKEYNWNENI